MLSPIFTELVDIASDATVASIGMYIYWHCTVIEEQTRAFAHCVLQFVKGI
jgi:hypothetical protein